MTDAARWEYLEGVRQGAIRVAIRAKMLQEFPAPRTDTARQLEDEMARRFAAEVVHLQDDLNVLPERVPSGRIRRWLRILAVWIWKIAN